MGRSYKDRPEKYRKFIDKKKPKHGKSKNIQTDDVKFDTPDDYSQEPITDNT
jgi:hypothetical protein